MRALDLFCGGGGAALGLIQAGFEVVGIDNTLHRHYPGDFIQADALRPPVDLADFDFIWASPPCQAFSVVTKCRPGISEKHLNLIPATRELIKDHPFTCIENVSTAPLRADLTLWGPQFGLGPTEKTDGLWRKRIFELSFFCWSLPKPTRINNRNIAVTTTMCSNRHFYRRKSLGLPGRPSKLLTKHIMGIPLCFPMTFKEIGEAVPPPYSHYIATQALSLINRRMYITDDKRNNLLRQKRPA